MKTFITQLRALRACSEGLKFAEGFDSWQACWDAIPRGDWSLWLLDKQAGPVDSESRRKVVGVCSAIAREVLPIFEQRRPDDKRVRNCIELCERYASGDQVVSLENLREARYAAYAAAAHAAAAHAYAADAAAYAAYAAKRKEMRDKFRARFEELCLQAVA